jgi:hypothetical protein
MFRKNISDQETDRCISSDPLDNEIIERLFKKDIREDRILKGAKPAEKLSGMARETFPSALCWRFQKARPIALANGMLSRNLRIGVLP